MAERAHPPVVRLLVTVAAVAAFVVLGRCPLPGVLPDAWGESGFPPGLSFAPFMLDFLWAYLLVELVAVVAPGLRRLRDETGGGRPKLFRAAIAVALAVTALKALGVMFFLEDADWVAEPGARFRVVFLGSYVGAAALAATLALAISRHGLSTGFGALFAGAWALEVPGVRAIEQARFAGILPELSLSVAALIGAFLWLRRLPARTQPEGGRGALPLPAAGILPLLVGAGFVPWVAEALPFDGPTNALVAALARVLVVGLVLSFVLIGTRELARAYGAAPAELRRARLQGGALSLAWLGALVLVEDAAGRAGVELGLGLVALVAVAAVLDDVVEEWRFRCRHGALVPIHELQRLWLGGLVRAACEERGIPVLLRGASFRSLLQGLGPLFEVTVLVPEARADEARELVRKRLAAALGETGAEPTPADAPAADPA